MMNAEGFHSRVEEGPFGRLLPLQTGRADLPHPAYRRRFVGEHTLRGRLPRSSCSPKW